MATGDNQCVPLYEPATRITGRATAAVVGGTFVRASANLTSGPLLNTSADGSNVQVATCGAGVKAFGVAGADASGAGEICPVINGPGTVVPMIAGASITVGNEVESNATGQPIPLASGRANGYAISGAAGAAVAYIRLYT